MPGLFELNAVAAIAAHKSFRRAAAELGISPSALSHAVAMLEQRMGVRLFNRTTRSVSLSEAGERFLARVRPALREISQAMEAVNEFRDTPAGTLRLNASERACRQVFPAVLAFLKRYPEMRVELVSEGRLIDIVAEGFDAGIRLAEAVPQDMIAVPCGPDLRFLVVCAPNYLEGRSRPLVPDDLKAHNCIRRRMGSGAIYRWEFETRGEEVVVDVPGTLTLNNDHLMVQAALDGVGLAYVGEWAVADEIAAGRLVTVLDDWTPPFPGLRLYYPGHRLVPAGLRAFIAVLRETDRHA
jgi:DNA-binding transcriptional LysR family regulator